MLADRMRMSSSGIRKKPLFVFDTNEFSQSEIVRNNTRWYPSELFIMNDGFKIVGGEQVHDDGGNINAFTIKVPINVEGYSSYKLDVYVEGVTYVPKIWHKLATNSSIYYYYGQFPSPVELPNKTKTQVVGDIIHKDDTDGNLYITVGVGFEWGDFMFGGATGDDLKNIVASITNLVLEV